MESTDESSEDQKLNIVDSLHENSGFSAKNFQVWTANLSNVYSLTLPLVLRNVTLQTILP